MRYGLADFNRKLAHVRKLPTIFPHLSNVSVTSRMNTTCRRDSPTHDEQPLASLCLAVLIFPVLLVLLVAVVGPLLAEVSGWISHSGGGPRSRVGDHYWSQVLGLVHFDGIVASMFAFGMAATLFMAGMELEFGRKSAAGPYGWRWAGGDCRSHLGFLPQPYSTQARSMIR